jgi:hypothetical protein
MNEHSKNEPYGIGIHDNSMYFVIPQTTLFIWLIFFPMMVFFVDFPIGATFF